MIAPPGRVSLALDRVPYGDIEVRLPPAPVTSLGLHLSGRCVLEWGAGGRPLVGRPARGDVTLVSTGRSGLLRVRGGPCEVLKIAIPDDALAAWFEGEERAWRGNPLLDRFAVPDPLVRHLGLALLREAEDGGTPDHLYRDALSNALVAHLVRRHAAAEAAPAGRRVHPLSEPRARRAVAYMESRLDDALGLGEVARELGLSTSHFAAQFRRTFGRTPARYLTWLRLERARDLLREDRLTVAAVARSVGFRSVSHFAEAFRGEYGEVPSAWRLRAGGEAKETSPG